MDLSPLMVSRLRPHAMATPKVPKNTRIIGGMRNIAAGSPPSRIIEMITAANARTMPARVKGSMTSSPQPG